MIKKRFITLILDLLRNSVRTIFLATSIMIALFISWFVFNFLTYLMQWLNSTLFSKPWDSF
ncbi:MAG: hypothetical protein JXA96_04790 [Sedimentisphaerales bacterium]|nr:hypothetical protein [Sedimentisphaerales bacterium]